MHFALKAYCRTIKKVTVEDGPASFTTVYIIVQQCSGRDRAYFSELRHQSCYVTGSHAAERGEQSFSYANARKSSLLSDFFHVCPVLSKIRRAGVGQKFSRDLGRLSLLPTGASQKQKALRGLVPVSFIGSRPCLVNYVSLWSCPLVCEKNVMLQFPTSFALSTPTCTAYALAALV